MTLACTVGEEIHVIAGWNCHCDLRQPNGDRPYVILRTPNFPPPTKTPQDLIPSWWLDGTQPIWKNTTVSQIENIFPKEKGETEQIFETPTNVMFFVPRKFNVISLLTTIYWRGFCGKKSMTNQSKPSRSWKRWTILWVVFVGRHVNSKF